MDNNKWPLAKITFIALLCLQIVTVGLILLVSHIWSTEAYHKHVRILMDTVATESTQSVESLLDPAEKLVLLTQSLIKIGVVPSVPNQQLERYLFEAISKNSDFSGAHIVWNNGDYLAVQRSDMGGNTPYYSEFTTVSDGAGNTRTKVFRRESFEEVWRQTVDDPRDMRQEAWFTEAAADNVVWTSPVSTSPTLSMRVSTPIFNQAGDEIGVMAMGIFISELSYFLSKNELSPNSSAIIANDEDHVISYTDYELMQSSDGEESRRSIASLEDERLNLALKALYASNEKFVSTEVRRVLYEYQDETYHAVFHSYNKSGLSWTVVIMAPESDFIEGIRTAQNRQILIIVSVGFLITLIAFMVALKFLKPVDDLQESVLRNQLTGLYNRRALDTLGNGMVKDAHRKGLAVSVAMIDIDRFKSINDTHGHPVGDEVLVSISQRMQRVLKKTDVLVRYGGEEFALVMLGANLIGGRQICERIRSVVAADPVLTDAGAIKVTVSIGVQEIPQGEDDFALSLSQADQALFAAKRSGRNRVCDPADLDRPGVSVMA